MGQQSEEVDQNTIIKTINFFNTDNDLARENERESLTEDSNKIINEKLVVSENLEIEAKAPIGEQVDDENDSDESDEKEELGVIEGKATLEEVVLSESVKEVKAEDLLKIQDNVSIDDKEIKTESLLQPTEQHTVSVDEQIITEPLSQKTEQKEEYYNNIVVGTQIAAESLSEHIEQKEIPIENKGMDKDSSTFELKDAPTHEQAIHSEIMHQHAESTIGNMDVKQTDSVVKEETLRINEEIVTTEQVISNRENVQTAQGHDIKLTETESNVNVPQGQQENTLDEQDKLPIIEEKELLNRMKDRMLKIDSMKAYQERIQKINKKLIDEI